MYLLIYSGGCASLSLHGVKFDKRSKTNNIEDDKVHFFLNPNGTQVFEDIKVLKIEKKEVVPEPVKKEEVTVADLKANHSFEALQKKCDALGLPTDGSKTELAERLYEFYNPTIEE